MEFEYTGLVPVLAAYLADEDGVEAEAEAEVEVSVGKVNIRLGSILYMYAAKYLSSFSHYYITPELRGKMEDIKRIHIPDATRELTNKDKDKNPRKRRQATESKRWDFEAETMTPEYQLELLTKCLCEPPTENSRVQLLKQHIHHKWYGYRSQDIEKRLYLPEWFVSEREIIELLMDSRLLCFYCRCSIQLFYEYVRESTQWSLERIDNTHGHNRGNVVIACLGCNVRRRTMYYERFLATKQMTITKSDI